MFKLRLFCMVLLCNYCNFITNNLQATTSQTTTCPETIENFTSLGIFEGHRYFLSDQQAIPEAAKNIANINNGYLLAINSQAENDFIQQHISEMVHIGLNDAQEEGTLVWDHHYFISTEKENWQTARDIAANNGGYLASLATDEEGSFLSGQIDEIVLVGGQDNNCDGRVGLCTCMT